MPSFAGFTTQKAAKEFNRKITNGAMKSAPEWCSECHRKDASSSSRRLSLKKVG